MYHKQSIRFQLPAGTVPTIEFNPGVRAWYIRFIKAKVAKTIASDETNDHRYMHTIDIDANGNVIGVELLGVPEFTIKKFRSMVPMDTSKIDFESARFVPAQSVEPVAA